MSHNELMDEYQEQIQQLRADLAACQKALEQVSIEQLRASCNITGLPLIESGLMHRAADELDSLEAKLTEAKKLVKDLERVFCPVDIPDESEPFCPQCGYYQSQGHHTDCRLAKWLEGAK